MKKDVTICNIKLSQHTSKCARIVPKNVKKFESDSQKKQTRIRGFLCLVAVNQPFIIIARI